MRAGRLRGVLAATPIVALGDRVATIRPVPAGNHRVELDHRMAVDAEVSSSTVISHVVGLP